VCLVLKEGERRAGLKMHALGCLPAFVDFIKEKTDFLLPFVLVSGKRVKMSYFWNERIRFLEKVK